MYYVSLEINLSFIYFLVYSQLQNHLNLSLVLLSGNTVVCLLYPEKLPSPSWKKYFIILMLVTFVFNPVP